MSGVGEVAATVAALLIIKEPPTRMEEDKSADDHLSSTLYWCSQSAKPYGISVGGLSPGPSGTAGVLAPNQAIAVDQVGLAFVLFYPS
jgi:hypothetical protein